MPFAQNTELVAFRVCHDDPRRITLTDVDTLGTIELLIGGVDDHPAT